MDSEFIVLWEGKRGAGNAAPIGPLAMIIMMIIQTLIASSAIQAKHLHQKRPVRPTHYLDPAYRPQRPHIFSRAWINPPPPKSLFGTGARARIEPRLCTLLLLSLHYLLLICFCARFCAPIACLFDVYICVYPGISEHLLVKDKPKSISPCPGRCTDSQLYRRRRGGCSTPEINDTASFTRWRVGLCLSDNESFSVRGFVTRARMQSLEGGGRCTRLTLTCFSLQVGMWCAALDGCL